MRRRLSIPLLAALVLACPLAAFFPAPALAAQLTVAVTVPPQAYFLRQIAGDLAEAVVMVPPGADPHAYEPKPSQMRALTRATLYCTIGLEIEHAWLPRFQAANPGLRVVPTDAGIEKLPMAAHHHGEADHQGAGRETAAQHATNAPHDGAPHGDGHHHGMDPHIWTAPANAAAIAAHMARALAEADPAHAVVYRANQARFSDDMRALDAELRDILAPASGKAFMVFHPAWGYLAQAYGLTEVAIEAEGKEPGPRSLQGLIEEAREERVRAVFVQPQMSRRTADIVAQAIGARVAVADPLAPAWRDNLLAVARAMADALR
ncbi:MAG: metal ABC transporter solute-binding protein, Zn/Mn family [Desulfovibrionaceae bacterium]